MFIISYKIKKLLSLKKCICLGKYFNFKIISELIPKLTKETDRFA